MRSCGDCKACCIELPVAALNKPAGVRCQHLCATGCGIHPNWPDLCRRWECAWRMGYLGPHDRPDKSGVIIWQVTGADGKQITQANVLAGRKVKPKVKRWLDSLKTPVVWVRDGMSYFKVRAA